MSELKPCDFCGGGETRIEERRLPPTMNGPGAITSAIIRHFCARLDTDRLPKCSITVTGRDKTQAIEKWNTRTPPPGYALVNLEGAEERVARALNEKTKALKKTFYEIKNGEPPPEEENSWMLQKPWAKAAIEALTEDE